VGGGAPELTTAPCSTASTLRPNPHACVHTGYTLTPTHPHTHTPTYTLAPCGKYMCVCVARAQTQRFLTAVRLDPASRPHLSAITSALFNRLWSTGEDVVTPAGLAAAAVAVCATMCSVPQGRVRPLVARAHEWAALSHPFSPLALGCIGVSERGKQWDGGYRCAHRSGHLTLALPHPCPHCLLQAGLSEALAKKCAAELGACLSCSAAAHALICTHGDCHGRSHDGTHTDTHACGVSDRHTHSRAREPSLPTPSFLLAHIACPSRNPRAQARTG
jgi:hypothetical protein